MKTRFALLIFGSFFLILSSFALHPYHVGSVEFNYNSKSKAFEVTAKFFEDDLESSINKKYGTSLFFDRASDNKALNAKMEHYCQSNIKLKANNKILKLKYLGYEEDHESVNIFMESEPIKAPKAIEATVSMLYNLYNDQTNIIHIIVNGKRQSHKLNYPNQSVSKNF